MNYIQQLKEQVKQLEEAHIARETQIQELHTYLRSSKFQGPDNNWVNPQDVLNRLGLY